MPTEHKRGAQIAKRQTGINLQSNQSLYYRQSIAKQVTGSLKGTEQVPQQREITTFDPGKEQRRATGGVDPALYGTDFKKGIDFDVYALELRRSFQIGNSID